MIEFESKEMGSDMWWQIVMSSPMYEAEALLKQYKSSLLVMINGRADQFAMNAQVHRINAELHRFAQLQNRARLSQAIRNICGEDTWQQVMEEAARLESEARVELGIPA